jgi:pimeloyl-ACP methyl ester carboxylesterase
MMIETTERTTRSRTRDVVLLHGQPGVGADFDAVVAALPATVRSHVPDRPGYGASPHPYGSLDVNAAWLVEHLDAAGIDEVVLAGHSYGGGVALAAAALAPRRVRGLVLLAGIGPGCLTRVDRLLAAPIAGPALSLAAWSALPRVARLAGRPGTRRGWPERMSRIGPGAWRAVLAEQRELFRLEKRWDALLAQVEAPTLILADPADAVVPVCTAYALRDRLPRARLELVSNGGHQLPQRIAPLVAAKIGSFVDSVD